MESNSGPSETTGRWSRGHIHFLRAPSGVYYSVEGGAWKKGEPLVHSARPTESTPLQLSGNKTALLAESAITSTGITFHDLSNPIKVVIGENKNEVFVPKNLVCSHSEFFKAACNERWKSGRQKTVALEEEDEEAFGVFLTWAYTGTLHNSASVPNFDAFKNTREDQVRGNKLWRTLAMCFVLAQFIQAPAFQNATIDTLVQFSMVFEKTFHVQAGSSVRDIQFVWNNTPLCSPLRKLVLDYMIAKMDFNQPTASGYPADYLEELSHSAVAQSRNECNGYFKKPWEKDPCTYHTHPGTARFPEENYSCSNKH